MVGGHELLGQLGDRGIGFLRQSPQQVERGDGVDVESFHQDAFGLPDDVATRQGAAKLLAATCPGQGDRSMGRQVGGRVLDRDGEALASSRRLLR